MRVAVVTGAGSGIGRQAAIGLLREGFSVVLAGRRQEKLDESLALAPEFADRALAVATDVASPESVRHLFQVTVNRFGRVDLLFNNAGINIPPTSVEDVSYEDWQAIVATNLTGVFLCAQEAIRIMKTQEPKGGRIINNGSISAHVPRVGSIAYTATKHAVTGMTKSIGLDCRPFQIACGQIDIGNADTNLAARAKQGAPQSDGSMSVEPTIAVDDVVRAILYMANLPLSANVPFMTVMATTMPYLGRG
jgi:NAD(P)-dependent dehydrogenase (short-subunit alcohol dehydrogenase family)